MRQVLAMLPVGVWIMDAAGKIVYGNPAGHRIWAGARLVGFEKFREYKGWWIATGKRIEADQWAAARAIRKGETSIDEEIGIECFDGTRKVILNSAMPLRGADGAITGAIIVNHDITDRKRAEERLRDLAEHDALTGAYSRRYLYERLATEIERARRYRTPLSLIMYDIDHFKRINDRHGHQAGDRVLAALTDAVRAKLRGVDCLARYGGEEFLIVAPGIRLAQAVALAERLRACIARLKPAPVGRVTCSFGVCEFDDGDTDNFIRRVDALMYRAKQEGRDRVATQ